MIAAERTPRPSRFLMLMVIALVLVAVTGGLGYLFGLIQGQSSVQQATLRISVENRMNSNQTISLLINGKLRQSSLTIPRLQTVTVDQQVAFAAPDGAWFEVRATNPSGPSDVTLVPVSSPGIYPVSLRLG